MWCPFGAPAQRSLFDAFAGVRDPRKRQGRRYPLQTLLTIIAMATACGMKGHRAIASFASHLTPTQRRVLRCPKDKHTGEYRSPKETCIRELLYAVSSRQIEDHLAEWMQRMDPAQRPNIALDGKTVKTSGIFNVISFSSLVINDTFIVSLEYILSSYKK